MNTIRSIPTRTAIATACVVVGISFAAAAQAQVRLFSRNPALFDQNVTDLEKRTLTEFNRFRADVGVPALRWDERLAATARHYGPKLASHGTLIHSPRGERPGVGENLWMGPRGSYSLEAMIGYWAEQRRTFRPGVFPNVSTTGNWADVSHYSQIIWPTTTHVGCALQRNVRSDYLICHFSPKGNRDGKRVP